MWKLVLYIQSSREKNMKNAFFSYIFLNNDISLNMLHTVFKIYMLILDSIMEGTVSQICCLCPRFYFVKCTKRSFKKMTKSYPFFDMKLKIRQE